MCRRNHRRLLIWILLAALCTHLLPGAAFAVSEKGDDENEPEEIISAEETAAEPEEEIISETEREEAAFQLYFGQLHAHSSLSDTTVSPEEVFSAAREAGLEFLILTDHGDSLTEETWASGGAAAAGQTDESFLALRGYEMSWPEDMCLGHIGVFSTADFTGWQEEPFRTYAAGLENFYSWLAEQPNALGQFHHPNRYYGNFRNFAYHGEAGSAVCLLEVVSEEGPCYDAFTAALDAGWHVAPANNGDPHNPGAPGRTVAAMGTLTEEALYGALRSRRVYATEDNDLSVSYTLGDYPMGSRVERRQLGDAAELEILLEDPTDELPGMAEVITGGGTVLAAASADTNPARLILSLPTDIPYCYLRITQSDGDIAVTAPVRIDQEEDAGISGFVCDTAVPVQGEPVELTVSLYNEESSPLQVQSILLLADGQEVCSLAEPFPVAPGTEEALALSYTHPGLGEAELTAVVNATLDGASRVYTRTLRLSWRRSDMVAGLLADGTHGNGGLSLLGNLRALAAEDNISVTVETRSLTQEALASSGILLVTAPAEPFSEAFLQAAATFVRFGGDLAVCADPDGSAQELNRLLEAVGSSLRLEAERVTGNIALNTDSPLWEGLSEDHRWYPEAALAVDGGTWLAGNDRAVLALEELSGARIIVCGSLFFRDEALAEPEGIWQEPYANRIFWQNLLGITRRELPLSSISDARTAQPGQVLRLRGYVTAGTSDPNTTFPGTLYFQDDTGGIAVMPFTEPGVSIGTPVEIVGIIADRDDERYLQLMSWEILDHLRYSYQPWKLLCSQALEYENYGGSLVQVEGICRGVTYREDGTVSALVIKDSSGAVVTAIVEEGILSGSEGRNLLHQMVKSGREFRVTGLSYAAEEGAVIRIRNCDEVVYISPIPYTGDGARIRFGVLLLSAAALMLLMKAKKHCSF